MIQRADLFDRLARLASGTTVVTPNRRLALALAGAFDAHQRARGLQAWEAPDILPFSAFVARLYEESFYSENNPPILLTPTQEEQLWRQALEGAELLAPAETAARCREAWVLAHEWRIPPMAGNEDASAFLAWSREYEKRRGEHLDSAGLPEIGRAHV